MAVHIAVSGFRFETGSAPAHLASVIGIRAAHVTIPNARSTSMAARISSSIIAVGFIAFLSLGALVDDGGGNQPTDCAGCVE